MSSTTPSAGVDFPTVESLRCPYSLYAEMRSAGVTRRADPPHEFVLTRHEDVAFALRNPELFSSKEPPHPGSNIVYDGAPGLSAVQEDPPQHTRQRKLIIRPFTPKRLREHRAMIEDVVDELIERSFGSGSVEFVADFAVPLPAYVTCAILGLPRSDVDWIAEWGQLEGRGVRFRAPADRELQAARAARMGDYLAEHLEARIARPTDDGLSELVELQRERDGETDLVSLVAEAGLLLAGGVVTTGHMLASAMLLLIRNPAELAELVRDPAEIPRMLEEAIRVESPVQWVPRVTTDDVELSGVTIPKGSTVLVVLGAANRDVERFDEAECFQIERPNVKSHVGFGLGTHFCLGAPLARMEGTIAFERLLSRFTGFRLADEQAELEPIESVLFHGLRRLDIRFDRR